MDVQPARALEEALGNQRAVGGDDDRLRRLERERLVQPLGLADRDAESVRRLLGRRRADPSPSALAVGPVA